MPDPKRAKGREHAAQAQAAAKRVLAAIRAGDPVDLADAKVLEAAGCWLRRNLVAK